MFDERFCPVVDNVFRVRFLRDDVEPTANVLVEIRGVAKDAFHGRYRANFPLGDVLIEHSAVFKLVCHDFIVRDIPFVQRRVETRGVVKHVLGGNDAAHVPRVDVLVEHKRVSEHVVHVFDVSSVQKVHRLIEIPCAVKHSVHILHVRGDPVRQRRVEALRAFEHTLHGSHRGCVPVGQVAVELFAVDESVAHVGDFGNIPLIDGPFSRALRKFEALAVHRRLLQTHLDLLIELGNRFDRFHVLLHAFVHWKRSRSGQFALVFVPIGRRREAARVLLELHAVFIRVQVPSTHFVREVGVIVQLCPLWHVLLLLVFCNGWFETLRFLLHLLEKLLLFVRHPRFWVDLHHLRISFRHASVCVDQTHLIRSRSSVTHPFFVLIRPWRRLDPGRVHRRRFTFVRDDVVRLRILHLLTHHLLVRFQLIVPIRGTTRGYLVHVL
mmetsp:Transcript_5403/g.17088  ORF Transcript_5403/g.17088 Transcript_5403/m.17088 type:complete len:438 (-) Transcript_5403:785-2098(-)